MADAWDFEVDGVLCRPENNWLVKVGMNLPKKHRALIRFKMDPLHEGSAEQAARG